MNLKEKMKSEDKQIQVICDYLISECEHDKNLAERVMLKEKTLDNMYQYILATVKNTYKNQRSVMVKDEDVYNMAIHYFIEDDETLKKELPQEKTEIKQPKFTPKPTPQPKKEETEQQISIFDLGV